MRTLPGAFTNASVAISVDGRIGVSGEGVVLGRRWDLPAGTLLRELGGDGMGQVGISVDGRFVLSTGDHRDRAICLSDTVTGEFIQAFDDAGGETSVEGSEDRSGEALVARLSPDGRFAISGEDDGYVRIRETGTGRRVRALEGHAEDVYGITLTPDDRFLLSCGSDGTLRLWEFDQEPAAEDREASR